MIALFFTFLLWAFAGCPDNPSHPVKDPKAEAAIEQLERWEAEDTARALARRARRSLGEAQARDPEAIEEMDQ